MAGTTLWDKLSDELSKSDTKQFKKKALSLLRIFDPSFQMSLDIPGVDFFTNSNKEGNFSWVVQCQIFDTALDLGEEHAHRLHRLDHRVAVVQHLHRLCAGPERRRGGRERQ